MGMECLYGGKDWRQGMFDMHMENVNLIKDSLAMPEEEKAQHIEDASQFYEDAIAVFERYAEHDAEKPLLGPGWKVVSLEEEFLVNLIGAEDQLYGFIDMIVEDADGGIWGIEHKSGEQFFDVEQLALNEQTSLYISVLKNYYGNNVKGMIYNLVRTKVPSVPKMTKAKGMSKAAIDTTWEVYKEALLENGLDPADYVDMQMKLENNKFVDRSYIYRTNKELNNFIEETAHVMHAIVDQDPDTCYRTPTRDCKWDCKEFHELCIMDLKGLDTTYYKERAFVTRQSGRDTEPTEDQELPEND